VGICEPLLAELNQESQGTRTTLERVPEERLDWRPHAKSMTLGELATHLANVGSWTALTVKQERYDMEPPGEAPRKKEPLRSRKAILERFEKNLAESREALEAASDEDLQKPWTLMMKGQTLFTMPKVAVLRTFVLNHTVHHRAQLGVYLRLLDVPVPPLYGPSADEAPQV
jgi:uncharacterized damage-inducible protein DinB